MKLNKFLRQCQPQPGSFFFVSIITAHLAKLLEDRRLFSWRNTRFRFVCFLDPFLLVLVIDIETRDPFAGETQVVQYRLKSLSKLP